MSVPNLRGILQVQIGALKDRETLARLPGICNQLGLPQLGTEGSKRDRLLSSFAAVPDDELARVAENLLQHFPPDPDIRNKIQEILWLDTPCPEVPKRFRREIANRLSPDDLFLEAKHFMGLLDRVWVLEDSVSILWGDSTGSLRAKIERHVLQNPGDWSVNDLFEELGAYTASDRRFLNFLEGLASSDVRPDVASQSGFVAAVNEVLAQCQIELQATGTDGGYPLFTAVSIGKNVRSSAKNLIFASSLKPDLRFNDAINNDVEVVTNQDKVLIYDRPVGVGGLTWQELQDWWAAEHHLNDIDAKKGLYHRLRDCLPDNSPPQRLLFESYFKRFGTQIPVLPALLPEVWLHWDPKTVRERGKDALLRFRMDFLMLLPNSVRVVIEVDGKEHYVNAQGQVDPAKYAAMVSADRDLRLVGYDVYRFGATDLTGDEGFRRASDFFERLLRLYKVRFGNTHPIP